MLQDKFLTPQLDLVSSDPGKFVAWLVLGSSLLTCLLGHTASLALLAVISLVWICSANISLESAGDDQDQEDEWLLDRFLCFLHQLDNGESPFSHQSSAVSLPDTFEMDSSSLAECEECETARRETVCSAVSLQRADSSSHCSSDLEPEDLEDFEFITAEDLEN